MKVAVLDDYQSVAESLADWSQLPQGTEVTFFSDHLTSEDALADRLAAFDVVMGMRERTPFPTLSAGAVARPAPVGNHWAAQRLLRH